MILTLVAACAFAAPAAATQQVRIPAFWRSLAQCETGGRWDWGAQHRPGEGHTYEGGLGFYAPTWTSWQGHVGVHYTHAWQAPPLIQVRVAAWGLAHGGYWGCLRHVSPASFPRYEPPWLDLQLV